MITDVPRQQTSSRQLQEDLSFSAQRQGQSTAGSGVLTWPQGVETGQNDSDSVTRKTVTGTQWTIKTDHEIYLDSLGECSHETRSCGAAAMFELKRQWFATVREASQAG